MIELFVSSHPPKRVTIVILQMDKLSWVVKFCPEEVVSPANMLIHQIPTVAVYISLQFVLKQFGSKQRGCG